MKPSWLISCILGLGAHKRSKVENNWTISDLLFLKEVSALYLSTPQPPVLPPDL
ncbi:Bgt-20555 [Blumeria graminis f. sp. tritici]|uniref:Bgt-20555 n=2 Tax=Blumeria graminis f. sp. tritici TaxID=62690 RepID=A0A381L9R9_BLUGR|nr:Bgt-20555 [Blumeria graminis f. sp. tritici]